MSMKIDIRPGDPSLKFDGRTIIVSADFANADIEDEDSLAYKIRELAHGPLQRMSAVLGKRTDMGLRFHILINTDEPMNTVLDRLSCIFPPPQAITVNEVVGDPDIWSRTHEILHHLITKQSKNP